MQDFTLSISVFAFVFMFIIVAFLEHDGEPVQPNRELVDSAAIKPHDHEFKDFRFVTFGSSNTWGVGLDDRRKAYPYLLSSEVVNVAIPDSNPDHPALCAYSMIGDELFDVIILEYFFNADSYLVHLAHRLRYRFPKAHIVFLLMWSPSQIVYKGEGSNRGLSVKTIMEREHAQPHNYQETFEKIFAKYPDHGAWEYRLQSEVKEALDKAVSDVNGHVISPDLDHNTLVRTMRKFKGLHQHDTVTLSEDGHDWVTRAVLEILRDINAQKGERYEYRNWDGTDYCRSWFTDGDVSGMRFGTTLALNEFNAHRYALEMKETAWIDFVNPMTKPGEVYIEYAVENEAAPESQRYPRVRVFVEGTYDTPEGVEINPNQRIATEVGRTYIGTIAPGGTKIKVDTIEFTKQPFRITGIIVTAKDELKVDNQLRGQSIREYVESVKRF